MAAVAGVRAIRSEGRDWVACTGSGGSTQIVNVSREIDAHLIVMGVTARGAIGRRLLGSTAVRVMRSAGRPVLAVPERLRKTAVTNVKSNAVTTSAA
jgi:nucleotide-binding universal stress UspA family protein